MLLHNLRSALLFLAAVSIALAGCSNSESQAKAAGPAASSEDFKPPVKGETMAQVKAQFDREDYHPGDQL